MDEGDLVMKAHETKRGMRTGFLALLAGLWVWGVGTQVFAQGAGVPGGGMGYNAVVARLFNDIPAFTATVETALTNTADKSRLIIPMKMAKRQDKIRIEVDFEKMKGEGVAMSALASMKSVGMARMTSVVSPGDRTMYVLFPELKFASRVALTDDDLPNAGFKVSKKSQGKETLNGQSCVRQKIVISADGGEKTEATTWESPALGNFPVRIMLTPEGSQVAMSFSNVQLTAPDEDAFKVPSDYKSFDSMTQLFQEATAKALGVGK
jgi:hypothetical protein